MATDHVRPLARLDVLARVPRMLTDRESPLVIRWGDLPSLLPWFARFAWAGRAAEVARSEAAMGETMPHALPAWRTMLDEAGARELLVEKGSLIAYEQQRTFEGAAAERAIMRRNERTARGAQRRRGARACARPVVGNRRRHLFPRHPRMCSTRISSSCASPRPSYATADGSRRRGCSACSPPTAGSPRSRDRRGREACRRLGGAVRWRRFRAAATAPRCQGAAHVGARLSP